MNYLKCMTLLLIAVAQGVLLSNVNAATSTNVISTDKVIKEFNSDNIETPRGLSSAEEARSKLRNLVRKKFKGMPGPGRWDSKNERIMVIKSAGATIEPYASDFLEQREALAIEASLMAKAQIIESFLTTASASNILEVPGNPIADQLDAEKQELKQLEAAAKRNLEIARNETRALVSAYDESRADELSGITTMDRLNSLIEATVKKLDSNFNKEQIAEDKRERLENIKARLEKAREYEKDKQRRQDEITKKIAELRGNIKKEQKSEIATTSSMPLFGATILMQVESYDDIRSQYNVASLVIWSPKLEMEARNILISEGKGEPKSNRLTLDEWLDKQDLSSMIGARRYLSKDGSVNFMGISSVEYDPDDSGSYSMSEEEAILWAKQAAILSIKSSVESQKQAERLKRDVVGGDGKTISRTYKSMSLALQESVKDLSISGLEAVRVEDHIHQPTGKNMIVAVANVNSVLAVRAKDLMRDTYATLKEVNAKQSYDKGLVGGMKAEANKTLNSASEYSAGKSDGSKAVRDEQAARTAKEEQKESTTNNNVQNEATNTKSSTSAQDARSGSWSGDYEVDVDF